MPNLINIIIPFIILGSTIALICSPQPLFTYQIPKEVFDPVKTLEDAYLDDWDEYKYQVTSIKQDLCFTIDFKGTFPCKVVEYNNGENSGFYQRNHSTISLSSTSTEADIIEAMRNLKQRDEEEALKKIEQEKRDVEKAKEIREEINRINEAL